MESDSRCPICRVDFAECGIQLTGVQESIFPPTTRVRVDTSNMEPWDDTQEPEEVISIEDEDMPRLLDALDLSSISTLESDRMDTPRGPAGDTRTNIARGIANYVASPGYRDEGIVERCNTCP